MSVIQVLLVLVLAGFAAYYFLPRMSLKRYIATGKKLLRDNERIRVTRLPQEIIDAHRATSDNLELSGKGRIITLGNLADLFESVTSKNTALGLFSKALQETFDVDFEPHYIALALYAYILHKKGSNHPLTQRTLTRLIAMEVGE